MRKEGFGAFEAEVNRSCNNATKRNLLPILKKLDDDLRSLPPPRASLAPATPTKATTPAPIQASPQAPSPSPSSSSSSSLERTVGENSLLKNPGKRERRAYKLRSFSWRDILETSKATDEILMSLSIELLSCVDSALHSLMVSTEVGHHHQAVKALTGFLPQDASSLSNLKYMEEILDSFDVFFRWASLCLAILPDGSSPSFFTDLVVFLKRMVEFLVKEGTYLSDSECRMFLPVLIHTSPSLSQDSHSLHSFLLLVAQIYAGSRLFEFLVEALANPVKGGDGGVRNKRVALVLSEIEFLIERNGMNVCKQPPVLLTALNGQWDGSSSEEVFFFFFF